MRNLFLILFISLSFFVRGQLTNVLIDTTSSASCKKELSGEYTRKFQDVNKNITASNSDEKNILKELSAETQKDFLEAIDNNSFSCDSNLNTYLQKLLNEILTRNNINPTDYKILLSKDSTVNARNWGYGIIVLNFGTFLYVENEDELMFILSHEIGHQCLNHVKLGMERYAKLYTSKDIAQKTKEIQKEKFGKATKANDLLKKLMYQSYSQHRKKEIAADSLGLSLYKKTLRNPKAVITVLQKLDASDDEKDSLTIADYKSIFEQNGFKIKEKYFEQEESLFSKY
ncbi:MAG TPA: M48 family metalloprotease, partial [Flavobacterium sp.]|uniref:M48 family metalloprotease n=1 Tax=Flavobacterium sp. TaxID=239 RepID=UPI002C4C263D